MEKNKIYIYGKHSVIEALRHAPDVVNKVFIAPGTSDEALTKAIDASGVSVARLKSKIQTRGVNDNETHQGVFASISIPRLVVSFDDFIKDIPIGPKTSLLLLGEITDPQNVGSLIRSAAAFGVSGVLIPHKRQAQVSGAVIKVSSGTAFRIPLVTIEDIEQTTIALKEKGFKIYGLDSKAQDSASAQAYDAPSVFMLGNESRGLSKIMRRLTDVLISVPIHSRAESLNVAATGAVVLNAWSQKHPESIE